MSGIRLLTSDLNGTLIHSHTMQEMIALAFPSEPDRFARARDAFRSQTEGHLAMDQTFRIAGTATEGLSLRTALEYVTNHMALIEGYDGFVDFIRRHHIHFAVISTGYSVTLYGIRYGLTAPPFRVWCNRLLFAKPSGEILEEDELEQMVKDYFQNRTPRRTDDVDRIRSTGQVILGIRNEEEKAHLGLQYARALGVAAHEVAHMGDTMGDSGGILGIATAGGLGIAFNYNQALKAFLLREGREEMEHGRIVLVDPKGSPSNLMHVLPVLEGH